MGINNYIVKDECSVVLEGIGRRGYVNSNYGRSELRKDCEEHNALDIYDEVMEVWGDTPTVVEVDEDEPEVKSFDQLKKDKLVELNSVFNATVNGSFVTTEGYKMQFNTDDAVKMFGAIQVLEDLEVDSGYITDADDVAHYDVNIDTIKSVYRQMLKKYAECHLKKQRYRDSVNSAETIDELNAIVFQF